MNNYFVVIWVNGAMTIHSEHDKAEKAEKEYFSYTSAVLSEAEQASEYHATVAVLDHQLDKYNGLVHVINKVAPPAEVSEE